MHTGVFLIALLDLLLINYRFFSMENVCYNSYGLLDIAYLLTHTS